MPNTIWRICLVECLRASTSAQKCPKGIFFGGEGQPPSGRESTFTNGGTGQQQQGGKDDHPQQQNEGKDSHHQQRSRQGLARNSKSSQEKVKWESQPHQTTLGEWTNNSNIQRTKNRKDWKGRYRKQVIDWEEYEKKNKNRFVTGETTNYKEHKHIKTQIRINTNTFSLSLTKSHPNKDKTQKKQTYEHKRQTETQRTNETKETCKTYTQWEQTLKTQWMNKQT